MHNVTFVQALTPFRPFCCDGAFLETAVYGGVRTEHLSTPRGNVLNVVNVTSWTWLNSHVAAQPAADSQPALVCGRESSFLNNAIIVHRWQITQNANLQTRSTIARMRVPGLTIQHMGTP